MANPLSSPLCRQCQRKFIWTFSDFHCTGVQEIDEYVVSHRNKFFNKNYSSPVVISRPDRLARMINRSFRASSFFSASCFANLSRCDRVIIRIEPYTEYGIIATSGANDPGNMRVIVVVIYVGIGIVPPLELVTCSHVFSS
jgi:hypothetical protein